MGAENRNQPSRRRSSISVFAALLVGGVLVLVIAMLSKPDVSLADVWLPLLVGLAMAGATVVIVARDRRERKSLPPEERDSQDHGLPD